jgi:hypothetical protein
MKKLFKRLKRLLFGIKSYHKVKDGGVFACDVDSTLISWSIPENYSGTLVTTYCDGVKDIGIPNTYAIDHLKKMKARNFAVVVWSAGGSNWAEEAVKALGVEDWVDVIMPKIDFHLDDVVEPKDKIGKWQYIDFHGNYFSMDRNGNVKSRKNKDTDNQYDAETY